MDFLTSTQRAHWLFCSEELTEIRHHVRESVTSGSAGGSVDLSNLLSSEEEELLLKYYEKSILRFCQQRHFSAKVQGTAIVYLKRFYVKSSVLVHDPSKLFMACIYVACKVEEEYCSAESLLKDVPTLTLQQIKKAELKLLKGLDYEVIVHLPYSSVDGITEDIAQRVKTSHLEETGLESLEELTAVRRSAFTAVQCLLETDAPLLFDPGKLALAAVRSGYKSCKKRLEPYMEKVIHKEGTNSEQLRQCLKEIDGLGVEGSKQFSAKTQDVQEIDRKLKLWTKQNHQKSKSDTDH